MHAPISFLHLTSLSQGTQMRSSEREEKRFPIASYKIAFLLLVW